MASKQHLKTKIQAVGNIKQITRAMQMVAAAKMRRSQEAALAARSYTKKAFELMTHVLQAGEAEGLESPFTKEREGTRLCLVVITSDKGLCGSYNSAVLKEAVRRRDEAAGEGMDVEIAAVGKKGRDALGKRGETIAGEFSRFSDVITFPEAEEVIAWVVSAWEEERYDKVEIVSTQFVTALNQRVETHGLLPLKREELERVVESIVPKTGRYAELAKEERAREISRETQYLLEPSPREVFGTLLRGLVRSALFHLVLEANASEHSARMIAMKSATENAQELQQNLVLELNKARQASITQEVAEISTAKEALTAE